MEKWRFNPFTKTLDLIQDQDIKITEDYTWEIDGVDTGIPVRGYTPEIGANGNWWINGIDTGLPSRGEKGETGDTGDAGESAYDVWLSDGNTGTIQDFIASLKGDKGDKGEQGDEGDEVELRVLDGYIQWKYEDQDANSWANLISLEEISGDHPIFRVKNGWVQWKLSKAPQSEWADLYEISGSGAGGRHNELEGLQGGIEELDEYYHLSEDQHQQLAKLLYEEHTMNLGVSPAYGEKGVETDVTFDFTINPKQDQIISVTDNYSNSYDTTSDTVTIQDVVSTISRTFTVQYDKYGEILNKSYTKTYNAYTPQWRGRHTKAEMNSYLDLSTYLGKVVQASTTIENIVMPTDQYIWFASNKSDAKIYDQNEFQQTIGTWGDGVSEFYTKPLTITLQDGTTATTYLYRTRLTKTIPSTFKYTIR